MSKYLTKEYIQMANDYIKKYSTSLDIKECKLKL